MSIGSRLVPCFFAVILCAAAGASVDDRSPATQPTKTPTTARQLDVAGRTRSYRLHLPPGFQPGKPVPLVIALHGAGGNGLIMEVLTGFDQVADTNGFAVAYPDGELGMWRIWPGGRGATKGKIADRIKAAREEAKKPGESASADVDFMKTLIDELIDKGIADRRRVYVTGISNGGYFSSLLACDLGDRIAAIAPVAGTFAKFAVAEAKPPRPVPVIYFHGTEDRIVGVDGVDRFSKREMSLSADEYVAWWAKQNSCGGEPRVDPLDDAKDDGTKVERLTHAAGKAGGAPVVYYKIIGGGHTWPGVRKLPEFSYDRALGSFRGWLKTLTVRRVRDHWKSRRGRAEPGGGSAALDMLAELEDPASALSRAWDHEHDQHVVHQLLESIRDEVESVTWEAFRLTVVEGRPVADVAAELGVSANSVYVAKHRVLRRLRTQCRGLADELPDSV